MLKPTYPVVLNKKHPSAKGLVGAFIMNEQGNMSYNLVTQTASDFTVTLGVGWGEYNPNGFRYVANNGYVTTDLKLSKVFPNGSFLSINNNTQSGRYIFTNTGTIQNFSCIISASTQMQLGVNAGWLYISSLTGMLDGNRRAYFAGWSDDQNSVNAGHGSDHIYVTNTATGVTDSSSDDLVILNRSAAGIVGTAELYYFWNRQLDFDEFFDVSSSPYDLWMPVDDEFMFVPEAVAANKPNLLLLGAG
jgi:hypothetical protein